MTRKKKNEKRPNHRRHKNKPKWTLEYWRYFVHEHSLSLVLAAITITLKVAAALAPEGYWQDSFNGFGDDSWGAFLIIVCTKYFIERGSPESRDSSPKS